MKNTVLVTAIGSFSAEAVIGTCKKEGLRVVGCDIYPSSWVVNSQDVDVFYQAPYATDTKAYREFMKELCENEQVDYILPLTDAEIDVFQQWRKEVPDFGGLRGKVCISSEKTIDLCRNKWETEKFLTEKQVCRMIPGRRLEDIEPGEIYSYPLILKPEDGRSSQGLRRIFSQEEMEFALGQCQKEKAAYLIQPMISGGVTTVDVVRNSKTGSCECLPRRELLRTLNGAGTSVAVFRDSELETVCRNIAEALDVQGCVNFEFIEHRSEQGETEWYFLECNPRFAGGVAFSCMAGYDMVKNHLNCFSGKDIEVMGNIKNQYLARRYTEYRMEESKHGQEA